MNTVLVTGAAGFLGKRLVYHLLKSNYNVVCTAHSEISIRDFERCFDHQREIPLYTVDVSDSYHTFKRIMKNHHVDYVVHAAALKHVGICEKNPTRAIDVNILGTKNIINASLESNVQNIIGISTDKAINPSCVYGMTKKLMEDMLIENNYGVFQGVNFLFSTGSVLDIWDKLMKDNKPLLVNTRATRYFCLIDDVCDKITTSLDSKGKFTIDKCYLVSIHELQKAFSKYHDYWNVNTYTPLEVEKHDEELPIGSIKVENSNSDELIVLLEKFYKSDIRK
jgi:UDP-N-acetylglucosamine 4,6-dehydratase